MRLLLVPVCLLLLATPGQAQKFPFNFNWEQPEDLPKPLEQEQYTRMHSLGMKEVVRVTSYPDGHRTLKRCELDQAGRLIRVSRAPFAEKFMDFRDYVYDDQGHLRQVRGSGLNDHHVSFAYDPSDRISLEEYGKGRSIEMPVRREYQYDEEEQLTKVGESHGTFQIDYQVFGNKARPKKVKAIGSGDAYNWYTGDSVVWRSEGDGLRMMQPPENKLCKIKYDKGGNVVARTWYNDKPYPKVLVLVERMGYDEAGRLAWKLVSTSDALDTREEAQKAKDCAIRFRLDEYQYRKDGLIEKILTRQCEDEKQVETSEEVFQYK